MYEHRVDKKIWKRASSIGWFLGATGFFAITYLIFPLIFPPAPTGTVSKTRPSAQADFKTSLFDRPTVSVLIGLLGGFVGLGTGRSMARDIQRRKELKELINQRKNLS